jgi:hypothetical protein
VYVKKKKEEQCRHRGDHFILPAYIFIDTIEDKQITCNLRYMALD